MPHRFGLAISTSSGTAQVCGFALDGAHAELPRCIANLNILFEFEIAEYSRQSLELLPRMAEQLQLHGLSGSTCGVLACNVGPGGFTSLRTACGLTQGLATAWDVPTLGASSFQCMWADFLLKGGAIDCATAVLIDARLQEFYLAVLQSGQYLVQPCQVPAQVDFADSLPPAMSQQVIQASACLVEQPVQALLKSPSVAVVEPSARGLAVLAMQAVAQNQLQPAHSIQPLYVREKVAQTTAERLAAKYGAV